MLLISMTRCFWRPSSMSMRLMRVPTLMPGSVRSQHCVVGSGPRFFPCDARLELSNYVVLLSSLHSPTLGKRG